MRIRATLNISVPSHFASIEVKILMTLLNMSVIDGRSVCGAL
jgi:hypothetical protein